MAPVVDALTQAPTVVFTAALAFGLAWWIAGLAAGSLGGHHGGHRIGGPRGAHGGHGHGVRAGGRVASPRAAGRSGGTRSHGHGGARPHGGTHRLARRVGVGTVPLSLVFLLASFGAWSVSLVGSLALGDHRAVAVNAAVALAAVAGGMGLSALAARPLGPVFELAAAPSHADAVGSLCRVRTAHADATSGQAEVTSGPLRGSLIGVRTAGGERLERDALAVVVEQRGEAAVFVVSPVDGPLTL